LSSFLTAQLGYTVPFTLVYAGKYRTEDKLKTQMIKKLNTTQEKQTGMTWFSCSCFVMTCRVCVKVEGW